MSTVVIETRCTIIDLCKALQFIQNEGYRPRSRAEIVSLCVKSIASLYEGDSVQTEEEALHLLRDALGTVNLGRSSIGRTQVGKSLRKSLQTASIEAERNDASIPTTAEEMERRIKEILNKGL